MAGAVALLLGMDAYANREIRSLSAEIAGTKRSIVAEVAKARRAGAAPARMTAAAPGAVIVYELASNREISRGYSIGSAETRNLPGR